MEYFKKVNLDLSFWECFCLMEQIKRDNNEFQDQEKWLISAVYFKDALDRLTEEPKKVGLHDDDLDQVSNILNDREKHKFVHIFSIKIKSITELKLTTK